MLLDKEKNIICQIACDNESGNHLLRKRQDEYWEMRDKINHLLKFQKDNPQILTDKDKYILEYFKQVSDYSYYKSLPIEKRLFQDKDMNTIL